MDPNQPTNSDMPDEPATTTADGSTMIPAPVTPQLDPTSLGGVTTTAPSVIPETTPTVIAQPIPAPVVEIAPGMNESGAVLPQAETMQATPSVPQNPGELIPSNSSSNSSSGKEGRFTSKKKRLVFASPLVLIMVAWLLTNFLLGGTISYEKLVTVNDTLTWAGEEHNIGVDLPEQFVKIEEGSSAPSVSYADSNNDSTDISAKVTAAVVINSLYAPDYAHALFESALSSYDEEQQQEFIDRYTEWAGSGGVVDDLSYDTEYESLLGDASLIRAHTSNSAGVKAEWSTIRIWREADQVLFDLTFVVETKYSDALNKVLPTIVSSFEPSL